MMMLACLLLLGLSTVSVAQPLPAASDSRQVWIIRPDPQRPEFSILHRSETEPQGRVRVVATLTGQLAPAGVAASSSGLWLVFQDMTVQAVSLQPEPALGRDVIVTQNQPALPRGVILRSLTASSDNLWALVRVEDAATLAALDEPQSRVPTTAPGSTEKRSSTRTNAPATRPAGEAAPVGATTEPAQTQPIRADRLLTLDRDRWVKLPLPEDWPADIQDARIIAPPSSADWPTLLVQPRRASTDGKLTLWAYRQHITPDAPRGAWVRHVNHLPLPESQQHHFQAMTVDGQTVIAHVIEQLPKLQIGLWVLRPERLGQIGSIVVDLPDVKQWRVIPSGQAVAVLANDSKGQIVSRRMELRGRLLSKEDVPVKEGPSDPLTNSADYTILVGTFVLSTLLLVLFWKREGQGPAVQLPQDLELADLGRLFAGVVDLLPCIILAAQFTDTDVSDILARWPGRSGTWQAATTGSLALGFYLLHTLIFELLFSRSIGKMIFGLRVVNFTGQRPKPTQIIVRNLLKPLDLIAWPLLLLPLLWNHRQRLADLVAGTLVVNTKGQRDEEENERDRLDD